MTTDDWRPERGSALRALLRGRRVEHDIDEEIGFHLEMRARQLREEGLSEEAARREAHRRFGDRRRHRSECARVERRRTGRRSRTDAVLAFVRDLRLAGRVARRDIGVSVLAITALGIGIGVTAAVYSIAHGVLLRELPYPDADRLLQVHTAAADGDRTGLFSHDELIALQSNADAAPLVGHSMARQPVSSPGLAPSEVTYARVTDGFFELLGTPPLVGRTPAAEEYAEGLPVVVLAHDLWRRRFGADEGVLGTRLTIGGAAHTVIGIMPPRFSVPEEAGLWRPLTLDERADDDRELHVLSRAQPGETAAQVGATLDRLFAGYQSAVGAQRDGPRSIWVESARDALVRSVRAPILALLGAAVLVLLVACVNVSNLLLARAEARRDQIATRQALGASGLSLVRQQLAESSVISALGCALGLALGRLALPTLARLAPAGTPRLSEIALDGGVVLVMSLTAVVTTIATALVPALRATRFAPARLASGGRRFGRGGATVLRGFVTAQVALSTLLVLGAALLGASFLELMRFDRGFATEGVIVVPLSLSQAARSSPGGTRAAGSTYGCSSRPVYGPRACLARAS